MNFLKSLDLLAPAMIYLVKPLAYLGSLLKSSEKTLIIRPGGMGDLIILTAAIESLGLDFTQFDWILEERSEAWAKYLNLSYYCYDKNPVLTHIKIAGRYKNIINSEQLFGLSQVSASLASQKVTKTSCFRTNRGSKHASNLIDYDPLNSHELLEFQKLLISSLALIDKVAANNGRQRQTQSSSYVIIGIAGSNSPSRNFPAHWWIEQAKRLNANSYLVCSSPSERKIAEEVVSQLPNSQLFEGSFSEMCEKVKSADKVLSIDGGFVHIASYFGIPTIAFFTSGRDLKWAPLANGSLVVRRHDLPCQPCTVFGQVPPCPINFKCKEISLNQSSR